ncbi:hypothetical protein V1294_004503 [Bradyrhizobium sp. AZCC 1678]|uniref:hypothetical protein n=1 Tax=Bradyrhizobium sp. AZCC 1678 TaxID=3117030 RepID=UPI002FEF5A31
MFYSFPVSDFGRTFWVYLRLLQSLCRLFNWPDRGALLNSKMLYNEMHNLPVVRAVEGCFSRGLPVLPPALSSRRQQRKRQAILSCRELVLRGRWRVNELGSGPDNVQSPRMIPEPREEERSGIWRKVGPQRQAECEVKRDACCDCNSGHIHFPVPHSYALMSVFWTYAVDGTWAGKMVPLSLENGRLGL